MKKIAGLVLTGSSVYVHHRSDKFTQVILYTDYIGKLKYIAVMEGFRLK